MKGWCVIVHEKILKIEEMADFKFDDADDWNYFDGFWITTNKQIIKIGIRNNQCCCEDWGYFISEDDTSKFIGAKLLSITETNTNLSTKEIKELNHLNCGDVMFVNFETDKGTLQFAAYNAHNGYYGHDAVLSSAQLNARHSI
jgi:hypothetical protein